MTGPDDGPGPPEDPAADSHHPPPGVVIRPAETADADDLATLWVELAAGQRRHGSHLHAEENRSRIYETMLQHAVTDTAFVARVVDDPEPDSEPEPDSDADRAAEADVDPATDAEADRSPDEDAHHATDADTDPSSSRADEDDQAAGDPELVGFVTFDLESERFQQDVTRGFVHNLVVRRDHRGRGIGTALLTGAERVLAERGADVVALQAMAANEDARAFYRRCGYEPHRVELEKPLESDNLTTDG